MKSIHSKLEVTLPPELGEKLDSAAARTGCSREDLVEQALRQFLYSEGVKNSVYLSAPINALVEGFYVENTTIAEIKGQGDFGLGTFNYLDGEMVLLDGEVYQIRSDGMVYTVGEEEKSPFACVTFFTPDTFDDLDGHFNFPDINAFLDRLIPSVNMLYAIRIDGEFRHVKTRAAPKSKNYLPLVEATKNQAIFEFEHVKGSLAGFYTPPYMEHLNAPGYHLHFLTEDRRHGGHLIGCDLEKAHIGIQHVPELRLSLPVTLDFLTADLSRDTRADLDKAEK
ncbi:MAG TPA: acetolactate decarboxylase [Syntrophorhabdaceae bacterium]|jgi:acetolactate decarboxylase